MLAIEVVNVILKAFKEGFFLWPCLSDPGGRPHFLPPSPLPFCCCGWCGKSGQAEEGGKARGEAAETRMWRRVAGTTSEEVALREGEGQERHKVPGVFRG